MFSDKWFVDPALLCFIFYAYMNVIDYFMHDMLLPAKGNEHNGTQVYKQDM